MQPATAVAESKCFSSSTTTSPASANRSSVAAFQVAQRAGHEQEHAEPEGGGHVGHDAATRASAGQRRAKLVERDAGGHRHERAGAEQRSRLGEHAGHVLRAHRDDHDVGRLDEIGQAPRRRPRRCRSAALAAASADTSRYVSAGGTSSSGRLHPWPSARAMCPAPMNPTFMPASRRTSPPAWSQRSARRARRQN